MKNPHSRKSNAKPKRVSRQHPRTFWKISKFGRNGWVRGYYEGNIRVYEEDTCLKLAAVKGLPAVGVIFPDSTCDCDDEFEQSEGYLVLSPLLRL